VTCDCRISTVPFKPLTLTRKNPYPWPGVRVFAGRGTGTAWDTRGLPLTITNSNAGWDGGEENGDDYEGERSGDGEGNIENAEKEGTTSFEGNGEEEVRDNIDDRSAVGPSAWDLEWEGTDTAGLMFGSGSGATMSQSAAAKFLKKSAATSKSVGKFKFKPAASAVGLVAGTKRKVPEDEDHGAGADQVNVAAVTERRNPARNIREPKKLRL